MTQPSTIFQKQDKAREAWPGSDPPKKGGKRERRSRALGTAPAPSTHRVKTLPTVSSRLPAMPGPWIPRSACTGTGSARGRQTGRKSRAEPPIAAPALRLEREGVARQKQGMAESPHPRLLARLRQEHSIAEPPGRERAKAGQKQYMTDPGEELIVALPFLATSALEGTGEDDGEGVRRRSLGPGGANKARNS